MYRFMAFLILPLFGCGCASTRATSYTDPAYTGKTFQRLLVTSLDSDLEDRQSVENAFHETFSEAGILCLMSLNLLPPTREHAPEDFAKVVADGGVDAVLFVGTERSWNTQHYIPKTTTTTGSVSGSGNSAHVQAYTYSQGGYAISKPHAAFRVEMVDASNGNTIWISSAKSRGNAFAEYGTLAESLAYKTLAELKTGKLVAPSHSAFQQK